MHQMQNLNNIISENNIIDSPFGSSTQKTKYKPETDKEISDKEQIVHNTFEGQIIPRKIENAEEINEITRKIFKK